MSEHDLLSSLPSSIIASRPALDDRAAWSTYWTAQGQPWRTEPEIDDDRQVELEQRRAIVPDVEKGIYPFKGMELNRADVEWLLATHEHGRGPVDWDDVQQRERSGLDVRGANLSSVNLSNLPLARLRAGLIAEERLKTTAVQRNMAITLMEETDLYETHLEGANLYKTSLKDAHLARAHLEEAYFYKTNLKGAILIEAHLEGAFLYRASLEDASLDRIFWGDEKRVGPLLLDINWGNVNLAVVDWDQVQMLSNHYDDGEQREEQNGILKKREGERKTYERARRASHQLAIALQSQGLNEVATRFAYRAQILQRRLFWLQLFMPNTSFKMRLKSLQAWFFSWFLYLIAGYGYRPRRSFIAYLLVISGFATVYYILGHALRPELSPLGAFVFSMTSFHGRGFFPGNNISLDNPLTVLAALEALVGLIIEVTFIATLTQRFFNR